MDEELKKLLNRNRGLLYSDIEKSLNDLIGLCLDQIQLVYPHEKGDGSPDEKRFGIVKRIILNRLNNTTFPDINKALQKCKVTEYNNRIEMNITFANPTRANGKRLQTKG